MASGTLYTYDGNFRAHKILVAAEFSGAKVKVESGPPNFVFGVTNHSPEYLRKFPLGKVPAFESSDGKFIFESNAIAHFVGNEQLRGANALDQAHILQWINFADHEVLPSSSAWLFPSLSLMHPNKQAIERAKEDIKKLLTVLNNHLLLKTFLVGERITQADIALACTLAPLYQHVMDAAFRAPFQNVERWFNTLINQKQFKTVLGEVKLCEKPSQFDAKLFAELEKKDDNKKAGGGTPAASKEKKPKEQKPKEEKKVEKEELDETEAILAAESKSKDPFDEFPKGNFNFDDFKRVYSNEDEKVSVPYFWEKFDKDNFSIWYCEYKYPQELTKVYMSCNLISGMFQRLDKMRKNAFGSMILFGEDDKSTIAGIWVWRGHQLAFELASDWQVDFESYNWKKLDANSEETKKIVNEYFFWEGEFGGKKFNQGKIFK
ncbi:Elongation factor 1-gamma 1 [Chamberlinius hualienensis]